MAQITFNENLILHIYNNALGNFQAFPYSANWVNNPTGTGDYNPSFAITGAPPPAPSVNDFDVTLFSCSVIGIDCMIDAKMYNGAQNIDLFATDSTTGIRRPFSYKADLRFYASNIFDINFSNVEVTSTVNQSNDRSVEIQKGAITHNIMNPAGLNSNLFASIQVRPYNPASDGLLFSGKIYLKPDLTVGAYLGDVSGYIKEYKENGVPKNLTLSGTRNIDLVQGARNATSFNCTVKSSITR